jgi:transposase
MDREAFDIYIETRLAPTLAPGEVVILDNLAVHNRQRVAEALKARGAWFLFLPPYSPDLNPIEMAFSKLSSGCPNTRPNSTTSRSSGVR